MDVAGILSSGAVHEYNGVPEQVVNEIDNVTRYIAGKKRKKISFIDNDLPRQAKEHGYEVGKFYNFSLRFGTDELIEGVKNLIEENEYDVFIEVDVGGDILCDHREDYNILSPLMDLSSLYILDKVGIDSYLIEFGLGTDGELRPERIEEILMELDANDVIISIDKLDKNDSEIIRFKNLFNDVSKTRIGHTATMTLKTLEATEDIDTEYYSSWQIGKKKWRNKFDIKLKKETFGKVYLLDGKKLVNLKTNKRFSTIFPYKTPLEQFIKLKGWCYYWKTELDLCFYDNIFCLTPTVWKDRKMKHEIITRGLKELEKDNTEIILLYKQFGEVEKYYKDYIVTDCISFVLLSKTEVDKTLVDNIRKWNMYYCEVSKR